MTQVSLPNQRQNHASTSCCAFIDKSLTLKQDRSAQTEQATHAHKVQQIFAGLASRYNLFNHLASFGNDKRWLAKVAARVAEVEHDRVLDVAGGTGEITFALCRLARPPREVICSDFCQEMLEVAREHCLRGYNKNTAVTFSLADAQDLPFNPDEFDVVTVGYGIRNFADRAQAMREALRVLKPGGRYVVLEFATPPGLIWRQLYNVYLNYIMPLVGLVLTHDKQGFRYLHDSIRAFPQQEQIVRELADVGFKRISYQNLAGGIVAIYVGHKPQVDQSQVGASMLQADKPQAGNPQVDTPLAD